MTTDTIITKAIKTNGGGGSSNGSGRTSLHYHRAVTRLTTNGTSHTSSLPSKPTSTATAHASRSLHMRSNSPKSVTLMTAANPVITPFISTGRALRAQHVKKSKHIGRFGVDNLQPVPVTYTPIPVQEPPQQSDLHTQVHPKQNLEPKKSTMFEQAVAASSHYVDVQAAAQAYRRRATFHIAAMGIGLSCVALLIGFALYQYMPVLQLRVAGLQAGVAGTAPNFRAAGVIYHSVTTVNDTRVSTFRLPAGQSYRLTERATNWTEQNMIQNVAGIEANGLPNYTTVQIGGTTLYRFSNDTATWVKNGTWYHLDTTRGLPMSTLQQLVQYT